VAVTKALRYPFSFFPPFSSSSPLLSLSSSLSPVALAPDGESPTE